MSYNFGEIIKKLYFLVWWKAHQRATHATPPPLREPLPHILHLVDGKCEPQVWTASANRKCEIYLQESIAGGEG